MPGLIILLLLSIIPIILKVLVLLSIKGSIIEILPLTSRSLIKFEVILNLVLSLTLVVKFSGTKAWTLSFFISYRFVVTSPGLIKDPSLKFLTLVTPSKGALIFRSSIFALISSNCAVNFFLP